MKSIRSLFQYFEDIRKKNNEIKVAVYPDSFNKLKNIDIFPLSGISNKETILCNENGYYIHYFSDRYGFNNLDSERQREMRERRRIARERRGRWREREREREIKRSKAKPQL